MEEVVSYLITVLPFRPAAREGWVHRSSHSVQLTCLPEWLGVYVAGDG